MPDQHHTAHMLCSLPQSGQRNLPALAAFAGSDLMAHYEQNHNNPVVRHHVLSCLRYLQAVAPDELADTHDRDAGQIDAYVQYNQNAQQRRHKEKPAQYKADVNDWAIYPSDSLDGKRLMGDIIRRLHNQRTMLGQATGWSALAEALRQSSGPGCSVADMPHLAHLARYWPLKALAEALSNAALISPAPRTSQYQASPAYHAFVTQVREALQTHAQYLQDMQEDGMEPILRAAITLQQRLPTQQQVKDLVGLLLKQLPPGLNGGYGDALKAALHADIASYTTHPQPAWHEPLLAQHPLAQLAYRAEWNLLAGQLESRLQAQFPNNFQVSRGRQRSAENATYPAR